MILIIAEKKIAGERIAKILSNGRYRKEYYFGVPVYFWDNYILIPLSGHIIDHDFPPHTKNWFKTPIEKLLKTKPTKFYKHPRIIKVLKKFAKRVDTVIIATDYDREGELIGFEALEIIRSINPNVKVYRAKFSSITEEEIKYAFRNLQRPDKNLANSALARRFVDLYWGVVLTRLLSILGGRTQGKKIYSAGRVQTPTLALVVRREKEIQNFVPQKYWRVFLNFGDWKAELIEKVKNKKDLEKFKNIKYVKVFKVKESLEKVPQPPPYNTTSFLKDFFTAYGISTKKGLLIAENLYMKGYISYPRTASEIYPLNMNFKGILRKLARIPGELGKYAQELLNKKLVISSGKKRDDAHPPIHPVNPASPKELKKEEWLAYNLIVRRFYATLAGPAILKKVKLILKDNLGNTYVYVGRKIIEKNWIKYFPADIQESPIIVPKSNILKVLSVEIKEEKTKPPPRYSEGSLIKEMEKLNLGTKATRHEIISKIFSRDYVKGRKSIKPTEFAFKLISVLEKYVPEITTPEMTAKLEREMDEIAKGEKSLKDVIKDSLNALKKIVSKIFEKREEIKNNLK